MPPSGFHQKQSIHVVSFLELCLKDLAFEANELAINYIEALKKEINNIDIITKSDTAGYQYHLLMIVKEFYQKILESSPLSEEELFVAGEKNCNDINDLILSIHVPVITK